MIALDELMRRSLLCAGARLLLYAVCWAQVMLDAGSTTVMTAISPSASPGFASSSGSSLAASGVLSGSNPTASGMLSGSSLAASTPVLSNSPTANILSSSHAMSSTMPPSSATVAASTGVMIVPTTSVQASSSLPPNPSISSNMNTVTATVGSAASSVQPSVAMSVVASSSSNSVAVSSAGLATVTSAGGQSMVTTLNNAVIPSGGTVRSSSHLSTSISQTATPSLVTAVASTLQPSATSAAGSTLLPSVISSTPAVTGSATSVTSSPGLFTSQSTLPKNSVVTSVLPTSALSSMIAPSTVLSSVVMNSSSQSSIAPSSTFVWWGPESTVLLSSGVSENYTAEAPTGSPPASDGLLLSIPAIIGICSGAIAFIVVLIAIILGCTHKKKTKEMSPSKNGYSSYYNAMWEDGVTLSYINNHIELPKDNPEEMVSLDDDTFLQSLDVTGFNGYWADKKNTKL